MNKPQTFFLFLQRGIVLLLFILAAQAGRAQMSDAPFLTWEEFAEEYLQDDAREEDEAIDDEQVERLQELATQPLQLNRARREDLLELPFLSEAQVDSLLSLREKRNGFQGLGDLMFVRDLNYVERRYLSLFVRFDSLALPSAKEEALQKEWDRIGPKLWKGKNELETRLDLPLYRRAGYETPDEPSTTNYYVGNALHHILRYRYTFRREVAYGLTFEKDAGEPVAKQGFYPYDYISGYFALRPAGRRWNIVVGDFDVRVGQGLLFGRQSFGGRAQAMQRLRRPTSVYKEHTSADEANFFRGAAAAYTHGAWSVSGFLSYRKLDARIDSDTVRSVLITGLHRRIVDIERRRVLGTFTAGAHVGYNRTTFGIGLDAYATHYAKVVTPEARTYNKYYFRGKTAAGAALNYYYTYDRFTFVGETALDKHFHFATTNTVAYEPVRRLRFALQVRWFQPQYVSLYGHAIAQSSRVSNEQGVLLSARWLPVERWELSGYADFFRFPKPTYTSLLDGAKGLELQGQAVGALGQRWKLLLRYRLKTKQQTVTSYELLEYRTLNKFRAAATWTQRKISLTLQGDASMALRQTGKRVFGWMGSARTAWKPSERFRLGAFAAVFFADDYDVRQYAYEPQLYRSYVSAAFFNHGAHASLVATYRPLDCLHLSLRLSSTHYFNKDEISSGLDLISSSWKNDCTLQIRWLF